MTSPKEILSTVKLKCEGDNAWSYKGKRIASIDEEFSCKNKLGMISIENLDLLNILGADWDKIMFWELFSF